MGDDYSRESITVEKINANPSILNGMHLEGGNLEGLQIKNLIIKNAIFEEIDAYRSTFENVTFENCRFIRADLSDSSFTNVAFKNCQLENKVDSKVSYKSTSFGGSTFHHVLFENSSLREVDFETVNGTGGFILFKNMIEMIPEGGEGCDVCTFRNTQLRIINSKCSGIIAGTEGVNAIVKDTQFTNGGVYADIVFAYGAILKGMSRLSGFHSLVVQNSTLSGSIGGGKSGYLSNNIYNSLEDYNALGELGKYGVSLSAKPDGTIYLLGDNRTEGQFEILGGNVVIKDFVLIDTLVGGLWAKEPITALNLKNVIIKGGIWKTLDIGGGQWENVHIEPSILVKNTHVKDIKAYHLEYPKGSPWRQEGPFTLDIRTSHTPFEWEEIVIPTPEDFDLIWWPDVEPGYNP